MSGNINSGRHKLPTQMKVLKGTLRKDRTNLNEPKPKVVSIVIPPAIALNKIALAEWHRISRELIDIQVLTTEDYSQLEKYCKHYAQWLEASETVEKEGMLKDGRPHPCIRIANDAGDRADKLAVQFGLTPSSRSNVNTVAKPKDDPFMELMNRK